MDPIDEDLVHRRRGWWIRVARERREINIDDLAKVAGYKDGKGTVSLWEKGRRPVPSGKFPLLARVLQLPYSFLVSPPMTDEERLEAAIQSASDAERRDWDLEQDRGPEGDDEPDASPGRRSA